MTISPRAVGNGVAGAVGKEAMKVAIIGAGAAGLAAARQLSKEGIEPVLLEKDPAPGGVWRYVENARDRPMYRGLRTNLPRELMAYREKPWGGDGVGKSYVTHREVFQYLRDYAKQFDLDKFISYGCRVTQLSVEPGEISAACPADRMDETTTFPKIKLQWEDDKQDCVEDTFDAVCICNGHYAGPASPEIAGIDNYGGKVMHSIEYDDPKLFQGQTVLCVGGRASGSDLAREISAHAKTVYLSDSACPPLTDGEPLTLDNVIWVPRTIGVDEHGTINFDDSCRVAPRDVDVIIFCSGYDYQFPFINKDSNLDLMCVQGERRVGLLYRQLWHARYPTMSFLGLPHSVVPFPLFELQAEAVVAQLIGTSAIQLPDLKERLSAAEEDALSGGPNDPGRLVDTHYLGSYQWDYCRLIAKIAGVYDEDTENYIATNKAIYDHAGGRRKKLFPGGPDTYREDRYVRKDKEQSFDVILGNVESESTAPANI